MTDLANDESVSATECMLAARHSLVSASAAYQQPTTSSESNRFAALGFGRKMSEISKPSIKELTSTTNSLTQDTIEEVIANIEKLELPIKKEKPRSEHNEKIFYLTTRYSL